MRTEIIQELDEIVGDASKSDMLNQKIVQLQSDAKEYKTNKDSDGKKIIDAYTTLLKGLAGYFGENKKKSMKVMEDAADAFSKMGYSIEAFKVNLQLCSMYYELEDQKNAYSRGIKTLEHGSKVDQNVLANFRNLKQMNFLTNFLLDQRGAIKDNRHLIFLLSEKLLTINKKNKRNEYDTIKADLFTTIKNEAHELIVQKKIDEALDFLKVYGFPIDLFLKEFNDLVNEFLEKPDSEIIQGLLKICNMQSNIPYAKSVLASWKQNVKTVAAALFSVDPLLIPKVTENTQILEQVLSDKEMASLFMANVVELTDALVEDPQNKDIMAVFLLLNETLANLGRTADMTTVNTIIQATLQLRKIDKKSNKYASSLIKIFNDTSGRFAPMALIRSFYNTVFAPRNNKNDMNACDALAQFIGQVNETILNFPDSDLKSQLLQEIDSICEILKQNYYDTMWSRINALTIDRFLQGNPLLLLTSIIGGQIPQHPLPFIEALDWLLSGWRRFPLLQKTSYIQYGRVMNYPPTYGAYQIATQRLKPIIWLILFKDVFILAFQDVQHKLAKNVSLQHRLMVRALLAHVNMMHHLQICIDEEPGAQRVDIRADVVYFLKKMYDVVQMSDAEMEALIKRSEWRGESRQLIAKIIEFKNFCVYCNFNMERGAKKCTNCGKEVPPVTFEPPKINVGDMGSFFSRSESSGMPTAQAATPGGAASATDTGIRKCPKCGGLISADDNKCISCQYEMPAAPGSPAPAQSTSHGDSVPIRKCPKCGGLISADDNKCISCQYEVT